LQRALLAEKARRLQRTVSAEVEVVLEGGLGVNQDRGTNKTPTAETDGARRWQGTDSSPHLRLPGV